MQKGAPDKDQIRPNCADGVADCHAGRGFGFPVAESVMNGACMHYKELLRHID